MHNSSTVIASSLPSQATCAAWDRADPLAALRARFVLPEGLVYLDGNSLGVLPAHVPERLSQAVRHEWGQSLIKAWNDHGWFVLPQHIGAKLARLIGARPDCVMVGDSISINLFKILTCALQTRPERRVILTDSGNFPSDIYVAQGLSQFLQNGYEVKIVAPEEVQTSLNTDVAVVMLTEVDYRTAHRHDMMEVTRLVHAAGALAVWDLAHSAGAVPVDLTAAQADFAVGCTYKYLNGGPGSPAFLYVRPELQTEVQPALVGWWGHARPFAFDLHYAPAAGILRQQCGPQSILAMTALAAALEVWDDVDMQAVQQKSHRLCQLFIDLVEQNAAGHGLALAGPRDMAQRGSHVSFHCEQGYGVMQALIANGVIGDFRAPDIIRFGFTPLYTSYCDVWQAAHTLARVLNERLWDRPEFLTRKAVT